MSEKARAPIGRTTTLRGSVSGGAAPSSLSPALGSPGAGAYSAFLAAKTHSVNDYGFTPSELPAFLFPFQRDLVMWALKKGRGAIFADCGLGKTPMQLVWADQVMCRENKPVLILAPLAVSAQTIREGEKFGIEVRRSADGTAHPGVNVTNYERLHMFDPAHFAGVVCDESSILKNFDGSTRALVTEFMRSMPYRLLCSATAAPNDFTELGTSSEALGEMGHMDMLNRYFKNQNNTSDTRGHWRGFSAPRHYEGKMWRFKGHAEEAFWRWVCGWSRALRRPSDLGYDDNGFILPPLTEQETVIGCSRPQEGQLFVLPAHTLHEQREERRLTLVERCETVAAKVDHDQPAVVWCHLNDEGDLLERLIPDAVQVKGSQTDEEKESKLLDFVKGDTRVLVTKPRIGGFGLNLQHCAHVTVFPSHSYEQYYQSIRRCWRFGQTRPVTVDIVTTEGELGVLKNLHRKAEQADQMFTNLVKYMNDALYTEHANPYTTREEVPAWL
jgi:hypothetical protein